jgi:hypothetical protein
MKQFDLEPGPLVGRLLAAIQEGQAAGEVETRQEAFDLAQRLLRKVSDPEFPMDDPI